MAIFTNSKITIVYYFSFLIRNMITINAKVHVENLGFCYYETYTNTQMIQSKKKLKQKYS